MQKRLARFFLPPIFADDEKNRVARLIFNFSWLAILVMAFLIFFRIQNTKNITLVSFLVIILLLLLVQYMTRKGYVYAASIFIVFSLWGTLTQQAWASDGLRDLAVVAYILVVVLASLLLGWKFASFATLLSILAVWYFAIMEQIGARQFVAGSPLGYARDMTGIMVLVGILLYMLNADWNKILQASRLELRERLRAEEQLQIHANYLAALNETALGLLNRSQLNPLLEMILMRACELLDTRHGLIEMVLPDKSALRQEVGVGILSAYTGSITPKNEGVTGTVWETGKTLVVQDYRTWENRLEEFSGAGFNAVMGVPLKVGNEVIGVISVSFVEKAQIITREQVDMMERFAALAAIAIDNARLYEQTQKELAERKAAEEALRASEELFRKVFYASPVAIIISSLKEGRVIQANEAYWKLSGFTFSDVQGKTAVEIGIWRSESERNQFVNRLRRSYSIYDSEYRFTTKSGEVKSTLAFYELVKLGGEDCILSMFYDMTEEKRVRESLEKSEARLRAIFSSIPDMIFEISHQGVFLDFKAPANESSALNSQQVIGLHIREFFPVVAAEQALFAVQRTLEGNQIHAFEYVMPVNGAARFFEARVSPITPLSAMMMVRDITQNKLIQTERENLINELEEKNSELERFTYTVSHDLKSPLITIKGFLGFLQPSAVKGDMARLEADIHRIGQAVDKMQMLLNDLLELSRIGRLSEPSQMIDTTQLVHEVVELLQGRLSQASIQVQIAEDLPRIYGDRRRIFEVFQNLIDNAAKFMGDQPQPRIEIGCRGFEKDQPVFYVRDNGIGIEKQHHEHIFGLFNKLNAQSEGTGVGLALVKRIVETHKGRIWVESNPGQGAAFFFTLSPKI